MKFIDGGVCAAKGYKANGIYCGLRKNREKKDLALILSEKPASAAAVYTTNLVKGAPLIVTEEHIKNGIARAVVCNSGNANTCNANGMEIAEKVCALVSHHSKVPKEDVVVASTGVIGQPLDIKPFKDGMAELCAGLSESGSSLAAEAIMTTDTIKKEIAVEFELSGKICRMGGIAKGSGMIHPNMATMLVFITTDVDISPEMLKIALSEDVRDTFNMLSIDGDTSTNDMVCVLANGMAENKRIAEDGEDFKVFKNALKAIAVQLCRTIAGDGEGATKLIECRVDGAKSEISAKVVAKSVICSSLVKAAMFGADANWGRVLCAIGYSGAAVDVNKIDVAFESAAGGLTVCKNGTGVPFSEEHAKKILSEKEIDILVNLNEGCASASAWGCDLTYDYVKINADYRT